MNKSTRVLFGCLIFFSNYVVSAQPILKTPGKVPIDTSFLLKINGVSQYLEIKGESRTNPVLLFIHGGPEVYRFQTARLLFYRKI
jgi:hypothetical protein